MEEKEDVSQVVRYMMMTPTVLFMTYADLMCNLATVLRFLFGDLDNNFSIPDTFVTSILCDEFHTPNNISEKMRAFLAHIWEEENRLHLDGSVGGGSSSSVTNTILRLKSLFDDRNKKRNQRRSGGDNNRKKSGGGVIEKFLGTLSRADSFRLLLELIKRETFFLMASAMPFQGNKDLHSIDHILRCIVPTYTTSCTALMGVGKANPDAIADASEYSTLFLEDVVQMLGNRGCFVSRSISLEGVDSSVVNCAITPLQRFAIDDISAFFMEMK
ncbi:hypothetical protein Pcinc_000589 [Petrolisthes cinctipes]|uniref:Uncharacterized protein n=1 Tax=Petrolisthes cinctipes TaxID=88211 RepID=A0AAE1GPG6_PETCI|nr:hypothetical protein Pcinc_000589 [Petrolisthes cinctipes]